MRIVKRLRKGDVVLMECSHCWYMKRWIKIEERIGRCVRQFITDNRTKSLHSSNDVCGNLYMYDNYRNNCTPIYRRVSVETITIKVVEKEG